MKEKFGNCTHEQGSGQILESIVDKIVWNLQSYAAVPSIITSSLDLLKASSKRLFG